MAEQFGSALNKAIRKQQEEELEKLSTPEKEKRDKQRGLLKERAPSSDLRSRIATADPGLISFVGKEDKKPETKKSAEDKIPDYEIPSKEQVKDRTEISGISTPLMDDPGDFLSNPGSVTSINKKYDSLFKQLPKQSASKLDSIREEINTKRDKALEIYKETRDLNQWLSIAETIANAFGQLGAGAYGLKHGVDLSGIKFNRTDWEKKIDRVSSELDRKLGVLDKEEASKTRQEERRQADEKDTIREERRQLEREQDLEAREHFQKQSSYLQQILQNQRIAERQKQLLAKEKKDLSKAEQKKLEEERKFAAEQTLEKIKETENRIKQLNNADVKFEQGEGRDKVVGELKSFLPEVRKLDEDRWFTSASKEEIKDKVITPRLEHFNRSLEILKKQHTNLSRPLGDGVSSPRTDTRRPVEESTQLPSSFNPGDRIEKGGKVYSYKGGDPKQGSSWTLVE